MPDKCLELVSKEIWTFVEIGPQIVRKLSAKTIKNLYITYKKLYKTYKNLYKTYKSMYKTYKNIKSYKNIYKTYRKVFEIYPKCLRLLSGTCPSVWQKMYETSPKLLYLYI